MKQVKADRMTLSGDRTVKLYAVLRIVIPRQYDPVNNYLRAWWPRKEERGEGYTGIMGNLVLSHKPMCMTFEHSHSSQHTSFSSSEANIRKPFEHSLRVREAISIRSQYLLKQ